MPVAIAILLAGFTLVYSALKGLSLSEMMSGETGSDIDAKGGNKVTVPLSPLGPTETKGGPTGVFKGPNAALLQRLSKAAVNDFNLRITDTCRPKNAGYGSPTSLHKQCRALDAAGKPADMMAFAKYAKGTPGVSEVFYDPAGYVAPGYPHGDHVHVGA